VLANGDFIGFNADDQLAPLRYAASRYRSGLAQRAADRWVAGTPRYTYGPETARQIFEFLFYDPAVPAADLDAEPLDWYGQDLQAAVFRSGWEKGSLLFALKSGPYGGVTAAGQIQAGNPDFPRVNFGHDHADDNGFYLYGNGAWLAPEASGYYIGHADSPGPQANKTVFHNSLLVNGQGQLGEGVRASSDASSSYDWFFQRQGGIPFQASTAHHAYAVAEGAKLYPPSMGLTRFDRHALFLDRRFVVLRDVVSATSAKDFDWLVHVMDGATREGSWLKGASKNGQVLGVAVVSPAAFSFTTTAQSPAKIEKLDADGAVTALTVRPSTPAASVTFLTALVPTTAAGWASRPQVRALDAAQPSAGLEVVEGTRVARAIFNDLPSGVRRAGGLELEGLAGSVSVQDGAPTRALLVQGRSIADAGRTLLAIDGASDALEADGLGSDVVVVTGQLDGKVTAWAPRATRAFVNGREVGLRRLGESVEIGGATAAEPALGGDHGTAPSAPALGGGTATDPAPAAPAAPPPVVEDPAAAPGDVASGSGTQSRAGSGGDASIGPGVNPVELVESRGGCSLGGGQTGALALLGLVALTARAVRRVARRRQEPPPADDEEAGPRAAA
jgi:hypothetical protein